MSLDCTVSHLKKCRRAMRIIAELLPEGFAGVPSAAEDVITPRDGLRYRGVPEEKICQIDALLGQIENDGEG